MTIRMMVYTCHTHTHIYIYIAYTVSNNYIITQITDDTADCYRY